MSHLVDSLERGYRVLGFEDAAGGDEVLRAPGAGTVRHTYVTTSLDAGADPKIVADRIGHANMAYTLAIYTHKSTSKDRGAAETVAGVLLGTGWTCSRCKAVYIGKAPPNGLCAACAEPSA
jgi:hypothetical protein